MKGEVDIMVNFPISTSQDHSASCTVWKVWRSDQALLLSLWCVVGVQASWNQVLCWRKIPWKWKVFHNREHLPVEPGGHNNHPCKQAGHRGRDGRGGDEAEQAVWLPASPLGSQTLRHRPQVCSHKIPLPQGHFGFKVKVNRWSRTI